MTDLFLKCVWALAVVAIVLSLVMLIDAGGTHGGGGAPVGSAQTEYFTRPDPARVVIEYGTNEGGRTVVYNTRLAQ